jgi:hypothetical protein
MELSKKTTILFPQRLHKRLSRLAAQEGTSLGQLVRAACERAYALPTREEKMAAVRKVTALRLPVTSTRTMKHQSVARPKEITP